MSDPISLRGIPAEIMRLVQHLSVQTGLSLVDVLRLALASGTFVELTKVAPDSSGTYGGLDGEVLAKALRRHLGSAIDLLLEYGQHPYQEFLHHQQQGAHALPVQPFPSSDEAARDGMVFDAALGDDLESLGLGQGISESMR